MRIMFLNQAPRKSAAYEAAKIEAQLNTYASPGTKVEIVFPDEYEGSQLYDTIGAQSVLNGLHHMMETPSIVRKIFWASQNGYDAVISSNTFDPGVDGGRLAVDIPVIGLLRTSMHAALTLADRVGITVPLDGPCPLYVAHPARLRPRPLRQRHPAARRLRQGHRAAQAGDLRDHHQADPLAHRRHPRGDHPAARRRPHSLRGQSRRSRQGDRRAGAQHQGDRHPLCRDVRRLRHDPKRADLSAGQAELRGFRQQVAAPSLHQCPQVPPPATSS